MIPESTLVTAIVDDMRDCIEMLDNGQVSDVRAWMYAVVRKYDHERMQPGELCTDEGCEECRRKVAAVSNVLDFTIGGTN